MLHCFDPTQPPGAAPGAQTTPARDPAARRAEPWLLCADCGHRITRPDDRTERDGKHQHTQVNPHGVIHRLACYARAPGCVPQSDPQGYWSWFTGYAWVIVGCGGCGQHLGWRFEGAADHFFGLLPDRLVQGA